MVRWMDEKWMITPDLCSTIDGSSPLSRRTAENKFLLRSRCQSSSLRASTPPGGEDEPPTPLTSPSTPPRPPRVSFPIFAPPSHLPPPPLITQLAPSRPLL